MGLLDYFTRRPDGRAVPTSPPPIAPMAEPASPGKAKLIALVGTAAAGLIAVVAQWEGKSNAPYADLIGKMTVCYGETNVPMRRYSDDECKDMLAGSLASYAGAVLKRNPELKGHDPQIVAASSLTYNIGIAAYNRSTVAKQFSAGRWVSACNAFGSWSYAGGRKVPGLANRRAAEAKICMRDIPARYAQ